MSTDDEFEIDTAQQPSPTQPRRLPRHTAAHPAPWLVAALVLVLVGIALVPAGGLPSSVFRPDAVGVLAVDASQPPEERWRVPVGEWRGGPLPVTVVDDVAVVDTGAEMLGISTDTGQTRWQVPVDAALCTIHEALTCLEGAGGDNTSILRVDLANGEQTSLDLPRTLAATDAGDDLITLTPGSGEWQLQRITDDGTRLWVVAVDQGEGATSTSGAYAEGGTQLTVIGPKAYVSFQGRGLVVDVRTGAPLDESVAWVSRYPYGYFVWNDDSEVALVDEHGRTLVDDVKIIPDDDPASSYELADDGQQLTVQHHGDDLWQIDRGEVPLARLVGVLITMDFTGNDSSENTLIGHDLATGDVLWSHPFAGGAIAASGSTMLVSRPTSSLVALDSRTGSELWTFGDAPMVATAPTEDGLILHLGDELVRVAWQR